MCIKLGVFNCLNLDRVANKDTSTYFGKGENCIYI